MRLYADLTLLHFCTLFSFATEKLCALDHSSNEFALSQGCHKIKDAFVHDVSCLAFLVGPWCSLLRRGLSN